MTVNLYRELPGNCCHEWVFKITMISQWLSECIKLSPSWEGWKEGVLSEDLLDQLSQTCRDNVAPGSDEYNNFQNMLQMPVYFRALWNPGLTWEVLLPGCNFENRAQEDSKRATAKSSGSCEERNFDIWSWTAERIQSLSFWRISEVLTSSSTGKLVLLHA